MHNLVLKPAFRLVGVGWDRFQGRRIAVRRSAHVRLVVVSSAMAIALAACGGNDDSGTNNAGGAFGATGGTKAVGGATGAAGANIAATGGEPSGTSPTAGNSSTAGGSQATGGSNTAGGMINTGGVAPTGGQTSQTTGGAPAVGTNGTGGAGPSGGASTANGGASTTGGATATGGSMVTGGAATGGSEATGGANANTGGTTGSSAIQTACDSVCAITTGASNLASCQLANCPTTCVAKYNNATVTGITGCQADYLAALQCGANQPASAWACNGGFPVPSGAATCVPGLLALAALPGCLTAIQNAN